MRAKTVKKFNALLKKHKDLTIPQLFLNITQQGRMHKCDTATYFLSNEDFLKQMEQLNEVQRPY
jgi:hypothetical protein